MKPSINVIKLAHTPILQQLQLEEALLKADSEQWCIINEGTPPAIVMGISGRRELLIEETKFQASPIPIIRRFSGGGTVVVDEHTLFVTFILNTHTLNVPSFPGDVFRWTEQFYQPVFEGKSFRLHENDYVMGDRKFGGNAQYLRKNRWLHHSSLLWDYDPEKMAMLLLPPKMPNYRAKRAHEHFLCALKDQYRSKQQFLQQIEDRLAEVFLLQHKMLNSVGPYLERTHHKGTQIIA